MTYPGLPFKPGTPLYPTHEHILDYYEGVVQTLNQSQYLYLSHAVQRVSFTNSQWSLEIRVKNSTHHGLVLHKQYDHLINAAGHNHYPNIPNWKGTDEWLRESPDTRTILHSIWYREPTEYSAHIVVVAGEGASGRDIAIQTIDVAQAVSRIRFTTAGKTF